MRIERDGTYIAVASAGGAPNHPAWYHNLLANPDVRLQDGAQLYRLRAREIFGDEKTKAWKLADSRWPHFPEYRAKAGREIPILLLGPVAGLRFAVERHMTSTTRRSSTRSDRTPPSDLTASAAGIALIAVAIGDLTHNTPVVTRKGHSRCFPCPSTPAAGGHRDRPDAQANYSVSRPSAPCC